MKTKRWRRRIPPWGCSSDRRSKGGGGGGVSCVDVGVGSSLMDGRSLVETP